MKKNSNRGFTLLEVLISVLVIGIIASIVLINNNDEAKKQSEFVNIKAKWAMNEGKYIEKLVGKWSFDEVSGTGVIDSSTFAKSGNMSSVAMRKDADECAIGKCLKFNGVSDYVEVNNVQYFSKWTYSLWINRIADSGIHERIMSFSNNSDYDRWFQIQPDDSLNSGYRDSVGGRHVSTSDKIELNRWYYVVATFDGQNIKLYIDGQLKITGPDFSSYTPRVMNYPLQFGRLGSSSFVYNFNGFIDEVAIYSDAITLSEIESNYLAGIDNLLIKEMITEEEYFERLAIFKDNQLANNK